MGLLGILKSLAVKLEIQNDSIFTYPIKKQKEIIDSFSEPRDCIERSFFQYRCQAKLHNPFVNFLFNIAFLPLLVVYLFRKGEKPTGHKNIEAVFFADGKPDNIIPKELRDRFSQCITISKKREYLTKEDRKYFLAVIKRYPLSWYFLFKCLIKIRFYRYEIESYNPSAIIVCNEYSFTSSLLTDYCRRNNIEHINVMHGEKLFFMMDSFFEFDKCYVWDREYIELFKKLRASKNQFIISIPDSLQFPNCDSVRKKYDYIYYLGAEHGGQLRRIVELVNTLKTKGNRVAIRPHPRYTNIHELQQIRDELEIDDVLTCSIEESIMSTNNVISLFSTVLNQAYHNGIGIVIDDVSDKRKYKRLIEINYVMLSVEHKLLSECI